MAEGDGDGDIDRIILVNPRTQAMVVLRGEAAAIAAALLSTPTTPPPASREAIESVRTVLEPSGDFEECAICLEDAKPDEAAKEMPCRHRFHGECIDRWLRLTGSCPLCRRRLPEQEEGEKKGGAEAGNRGVWIAVSVGRRRFELEDHRGEVVGGEVGGV